MEKKFFSRNKVRLVLVIAVCVFFVAISLSGTAPKPKPTYYLNIPSAAFTPTDITTANWYNTQGYITPRGPCDFTCPVYLPQGATVTGFQIYASDKDVTNDLDLYSWLRTNNMSNVGTSGHYTIVSAQLETTSYGSNLQVSSPNPIPPSSETIINNENHQYFIDLYINGGPALTNVLRFYGARITYTL